jgi:hypothetical protein
MARTRSTGVVVDEVLCAGCLEPIGIEQLASKKTLRVERDGITALVCSETCAEWARRGYPELVLEPGYEPGDARSLGTDRAAGAVVISLAAGGGAIIHVKPGVDPIAALAHIYGLAQTVSDAVAEGVVEELTEEDEPS